ncbi:MAG: RidA family protein [Ruminococcaceae bacterium]|nr:RidA family protein [Oscillospiraceae bacterium]
MLETVSTENAPAAIGPYAQGVRAGDFLFTSGQIALDPKSGELIGTDITAQTEQVMKNLCAILAGGNSEPALVIKTTCYLSDMADFAAFNAVYSKYITSAARSCVAVKSLPRGALVEVDAIARIKEHSK